MRENRIDDNILLYFAKYLWWENPKKIVKTDPYRVLASAMRYANEKSEMAKLNGLDKNILIEVLHNAQPGWFDKKSWSYWHYILHVISIDKDIPPLPKRGFYHDTF